MQTLHSMSTLLIRFTYYLCLLPRSTKNAKKNTFKFLWLFGNEWAELFLSVLLSINRLWKNVQTRKEQNAHQKIKKTTLWRKLIGSQYRLQFTDFKHTAIIRQTAWNTFFVLLLCFYFVFYWCPHTFRWHR